MGSEPNELRVTEYLGMVSVSNRDSPTSPDTPDTPQQQHPKRTHDAQEDSIVSSFTACSAGFSEREAAAAGGAR